jgi:mono/diheme cytochrome c family protein
MMRAQSGSHRMQSWFAATLVVLSTFEIQAWIPYLPGLPAVARSAKVRVRFEPIQIDVQSKPDRSVWHGVYTEAQQKRGEPFYVRECSTCHGETLKGGEGTPALTGAEFLDRWNGRTGGRPLREHPQDDAAATRSSGKADAAGDG